MSRVVRLGRGLPGWARRLVKGFAFVDWVETRAAGVPRLQAPASGALRPVVYPPTWLHWDVMKQRPQRMLETMAAMGHQVYFVDLTEPASRAADGVAIVPTLGDTPHREVILYIHGPRAARYIERFERPIVLYDVLDDPAIYQSGDRGRSQRRNSQAHHERLLRDAAIVMASGRVLADRVRPVRPDVVLVRNGVDVDRFRVPRPRPPDLPGNARPIVGYHGAIAAWFDFDLVAAVAAGMPDVEFVLVGPADRDVEKRLHELLRAGNVHWLGMRPADEIAGYVAAFDAGAIWFIVDDLTHAVDPLKLYEYLAAGVPVVATPIAACVEHPLVATAADPDAMIAALRAALAAKGTPAFDEAAARHAGEARWEHRVRPLIDALERGPGRYVR